MSFIGRKYIFIKYILKKLNNFLIYIRKTSLNFSSKNKKPVAIVNFDTRLMTADFGRYFYIICVYLSYCDFKVIVKTNWDFFKILKPYQKLMLKQPFQFVRDSSTPINTVALINTKYNNKLISIHYGYRKTASVNIDCIAPYPMHPVHNKPSNLKNFLKYRDSKRSVKIFFSGNINKDLYRKESMRKEFDVITRWDVINFIKISFEKTKKVEFIEDKSALYSLMNAETYSNSIVITEAGTASGDWLKMLAKADFFISPPGVSSPWCHNSIEAMSVGTIPILQYADLFTPHLKDKQNCLVYTNYNGLQQAVESALEMQQEQIQLMRKNVISYYNDYLSVESIAKKINQFISSDKEETSVKIPYIRSLDDG